MWQRSKTKRAPALALKVIHLTHKALRSVVDRSPIPLPGAFINHSHVAAGLAVEAAYHRVDCGMNPQSGIVSVTYEGLQIIKISRPFHVPQRSVRPSGQLPPRT